jgi:imidazolonepropionase-like amidohydrolase
LIDAHTHLTFNASDQGYSTLGISVPRMATTGVKNARITLMAGFTTVRDVASEGYADVAVRDAIADVKVLEHVAFVMKGGAVVKNMDN